MTDNDNLEEPNDSEGLELLFHLLGSDGELPAELWSEFESAPFSKCIECERPLLQAESPPYFIQKARRQGETVFEYALCLPCTHRQDGTMSEESRQNLQDFFAQARPFNPTEEGCLLCGEDPESSEGEREIFGIARGRQLLGKTYSICGGCTEGLESRLSEETRGGMDDFVARNFPGVPDGLLLPVGIL